MNHDVYISLGSNLGNRKAYLQQAIEGIAMRIGTIVDIAPIYETPSWGFAGEAFLNTCLLVRSFLSPEEVLVQLLQIEYELGRERIPNKKGYQSRTIDLDILFYDDRIINTDVLTIPHPLLHRRKFVLKPLSAIDDRKIHTVLHQTIAELLHATDDTSPVQRLADQLSFPAQKSPFLNYKYIAIEGNIGSGKTTLATKIADDFNAKLILEQFSDNPFLPKFYENPKQYGFTLDMSFLTERYQQMREQLTQMDLFKEFVVSDYDIFKSLIFSKITLTEDEFVLYRKLFYILYSQIIKPDLYVFLYQNTERLIENIKKRGRAYEQNISPDYLKKIHYGYLDFIQKNTAINSLIIDVTDLDFVKHYTHYDFIIQKIREY